MAFDEVQFPLRVAYGSGGGPQFLTEVVTIEGGYEKRNQCWSQARRKYDARTGVATAADASLLAGFFMARAGRARGFRLKDWSDFTSASDGLSAASALDQRIGTGDGVTKVFQLIKTYGSGEASSVRAIAKPVAGSVKIAVAGVTYDTGWSVDNTTGKVTFVSAPANGAAITAGYVFDVPVRFDTDSLAVRTDDGNLAQAQIPLIEVRV